MSDAPTRLHARSFGTNGPGTFEGVSAGKRNSKACFQLASLPSLLLH
jgi:hypothetical protein